MSEAGRPTDSCAEQIALLNRLNNKGNRHNALDARRAKGSRRRRLRVVDPRPGAEQDRVLVVDDEILVRANDVGPVLDDLGGEYRDEAEALGGALVRVVPTPRRRRMVPDAIRFLRGRGRGAQVVGANHVVIMGGTDKGGVTPEIAVESIGNGTTSSNGPLVIVVDTGIDGASAGRGDGWLDGVAAADMAQDLDPLGPGRAAGGLQLLDLGAGHGTFVAGVVRQVAPDSDVKIIRALEVDGTGTELEVAEAIRRAAAMFRQSDKHGILNLSLGFETIDEEEPLALELALNQVPDDVLVVAAAGNASSGIKLWPAAFERVIAVGSHQGDPDRTPSEWSNLGTWVAFSARGECVVSTFVNGREMDPPRGPERQLYDPHPDTFDESDPIAMWSGTSFSAPQIAGALAREWGADPSLTPIQVRQKVEQGQPPSPMHGVLMEELL